MNNCLPSYFNIMKPIIPNVCSRYEIRRPTFHLPSINHEYAAHLLEYQMIKVLNEDGSTVYTLKVHSHSFEGFKHFIKYNMINSYSNQCRNRYCESCKYLERPR